MHDCQTRSRLVCFLLCTGVCASLAALFLMPLAGTAATGCSTSSPPSNAYSVTLCIANPVDGSTVAGPVVVTTTVQISGTRPGLSRLVYTLDDQYLLTYFANSPYTFTLPSDRFVDGNYALSVQAIMGGGFTTTQATVNLQFANGITQTPVNHGTFTPTLGTTPAAGQPFVVAAVGDGAGGETPEANVVNLIASWNPNLFLYLGDVLEEGSVSEFYNYYRPSWFFGKFRSITDPTVGNHEYLTSHAAGYFDYWDNVPNYYSFDTAGWHMVSINANCSSVGGCGLTSEQYKWLSDDLAADKAMCTLVIYHEPLFDIGPEADTVPPISSTWSLMAQNGVDIVLNGHDHNYQRWVPLDGAGNPSPTGITEFIAGAGGHSIQTFVRDDPRVAFKSDAYPTTFGALRLELYPTHANFQYINTAGTTLDSGSVTCNGDSQTGASQTFLPFISSD